MRLQELADALTAEDLSTCGQKWLARFTPFFTARERKQAGCQHRLSLNGHIEVEGDTAQAQWYLFMPCTVTAGNQAMWRASIDHETYVRVDGVWMFRHKRSEPLMNVPFETG
jgi:SnoaL-like protein